MNLRKIIQVAGVFLLSTVILLAGSMEIGEAVKAGNDIRYFMQKPEARGSSTPYGNNITTGHYVQTDDAKIYYEVYGKGKPLFVFHGGGVGTPYEMGQMIDNLRKDYQVIVVSRVDMDDQKSATRS